MYTSLASPIAVPASLYHPHQAGLSGSLLQSCGLAGSPGPSRLKEKEDISRRERGKDIQDSVGTGGNSLFEALE